MASSTVEDVAMQQDHSEKDDKILSADTLCKTTPADDDNTNADPEPSSVSSATGEGVDNTDKPSTSSEDKLSTEKTSERPILYSTEHFKIRIENIHPRMAHNQIKQKLASLNLKPKKIKKMERTDWAFVTFECESDRAEALKVLEGLVWRSNTISVKMAEAAADPLLYRKRRADETHDAGLAKQQHSNLTLEEYSTRLFEKTCPLWKMSYEEQLKHKQGRMRGVMEELKSQMMFAYKDSQLPKSEYPDTNYANLLLPIRPSPKTDGYRNKCEFTVGKHPISGDVTVGYRLGEYKQGTVAVLEAADLPNTSQAMKDIATDFQKYVITSSYAAFDPVSQQGHWMWLLVRTTTLGDVMVMPTFVDQELTEDEVEKVKENLKYHYTEGEGKCCGVTSLYINVAPRQKKPDSETAPPIHLSGKETIEEVLLGLKFRISPSAFFQAQCGKKLHKSLVSKARTEKIDQPAPNYSAILNEVNKEGAEVLYSTISELAGLSNRTSTVLDVCCGTGTIGMLLSSKCKSVIGVELVAQAVEDAKKNAELNGVENIRFECGRAETVLPSLIHRIRTDEPVAVVDPPRAGLHIDVLRALRKCSSLTKLVYVSCEPRSALKNFVQLMRPESKKWKGPPFRLVQLLPVDMFPYSQQCELVLLFERDEQVLDTSD